MRRLAIAFASLPFLVLVASCDGGRKERPERPADPPAEEPSPAPATLAVQGQDLSVADVADRAVPSVVNIFTAATVRVPNSPRLSPFSEDPFFRRFFGMPGAPEMPRERRQQSLGSGVIVSDDGVILTNNHVVEGAQEIRVTLSDGREANARIVGTDPPSDLAVLRLEDELSDLSPLPFGESKNLRLGEIVLAIGNPFGVGQTVTMGIVSAVGRANVGIVDYEDFIQTDAAINPGNSGGALVDMTGHLVGVNTAILSRTGGYQGIGFAIPTDMVAPIMESLIEHGRVVRGWIGVSIQSIDKRLAQALDLPTTTGVLVSEVANEGPAARAGIRQGDVIVRFDGRVVDSPGRLRNLVAHRTVDSEVNLEVLRNGERLKLEVTLGELPTDAAEEAPASGPELGGLRVAPLDTELRARLEVPPGVREGTIVIIEVEPGSAGMQAGLRPGDLILEVNRRPLRNVSELAEMYAQARDGLLLRLLRGRAVFYTVLPK